MYSVYENVEVRQQQKLCPALTSFDNKFDLLVSAERKAVPSLARQFGIHYEQLGELLSTYCYRIVFLNRHS